MRYLVLLAALIIFSFAANAQPSGKGTPDPVSNAKATSEADAAVPDDVPPAKRKHPPIKIGNVPVPPEKAYPITVPKIGPGIVVDGRITEEIWKDAAVFKDFIQTGPGDNIPPSRPTEVLMMYDEKHLYIAFKCWDEKDKVRATVAKRDAVTGEDNVRVWLDTYNDQRRAYVLAFNPLGIQQDGIYTESQGADFTVDIVMESKGVIEDWGWSVEVKIPFKSLRYAAGPDKLWGFNAARNIDRFNDEFDAWLPDDRNVSGFLVKHGKITGFDGIKYERTLEIAPSVTVSQTSTRKRTLAISAVNGNGYHPIFNPIGLQDPGRWVNDPVKGDLGLNLKYTISPNITLDAAINPDYAEIEADAPVVTANQRFPIFFEEKRPFFLEGKEIFNTPLAIFYSRTIVDPDVAVKLTGKIGKTSFGFIGASDNAPGNYSLDERNDPVIGPRIEPFVGKNATFGILRIKRDVGKGSNLGFFASARTFPNNRNFLGSVDGSFKLNPKTVMNVQAVGTHSRKNFYDPNVDRSWYRTGNGFGYYWSLDYTTDRHGFFAEAVGRTRDFRSDAGFTRRTDTNTFFFANRVSTKSNPKAFMIRGNFNQFVRYGMDFQGRIQQALVGANGNFSLQGNTFVYTETGVMYEKIYEDEFGAKRNPATGQQGAFVGEPTRSARKPYFSVNAEKRFNKKFYLYGFVGSIFNAIDYDFGAGPRYPRASSAFLDYLASPEYAYFIQQLYAYQVDPQNVPYPAFPSPPRQDPGTGWQFDAQVGGEYKPTDPLRISLNYTKSRLRRNDTGEVAFDTDIISARSTYQFSRFTFVRARLDYDSLRRNYSGQVLFGWNPNPGTAFYVGYNDAGNYSGFNPYTTHHEPGFNRNGRTFFIRASYLFRKSF
ncbi:MAG TPA: DUF5916 domain-containing protein [Pyrinomonadaceae bacterium]